MEERSLRVTGVDTNFFSKITSKISKLLIPTKIGIIKKAKASHLAG